MMDSTSVIPTATEGIVERMAKENEISKAAQYAQLDGDKCVYPKAKKLIRQISRLNPEGGRLIKQDLDCLFAEVLDDEPCSTTDAAEFHKELSEAVDAKLRHLPRARKLRELRQARRILDREIRATEAG